MSKQKMCVIRRPGYIGDPNIEEARCILHGGDDVTLQPTNSSEWGFIPADVKARLDREAEEKGFDVICYVHGVHSGDALVSHGRCYECDAMAIAGLPS